MGKKNLAFIQEYQALLMLLYAPIYAAFSRLVFLKNKKFNYTEHLVIFMYVLAQISIAATILTIIAGFFGVSLGTISLISLPFQIFYSAYCLKRLYKLSLKGIILRTLLFLGILLGIFILFMIITIIFALLNQELFKEIFPQPTANGG